VNAVHQMLKDEFVLDDQLNLNLASLVGTYMEHEADALMIENLSKNTSDAGGYSTQMQIQVGCPEGEDYHQIATNMPSEAIRSGGFVLMRRPQEKRMLAGKNTQMPNIIM